MRNPKHLMAVSPARAANGITWLINCLLELSIPCLLSEFTFSDMWEACGNKYRIKPRFLFLSQQIPAIEKEFVFDDAFICTFEHQYLTDQYAKRPAVFMMRNPVDSLYSYYKRGCTTCSYGDFIRCMTNQIIPATDMWNLYHLSWSLHSNCLFYSFEDYRKNPLNVLRIILNHYGIVRSSDEIEKAVELSSAENARKHEAEWLKRNPHIENAHPLITGSKFDQTTAELLANEAAFIEQHCGYVMNKLGYPVNNQSLVIQKDFNYYIPMFVANRHLSACFLNMQYMQNTLKSSSMNKTSLKDTISNLKHFLATMHRKSCTSEQAPCVWRATLNTYFEHSPEREIQLLLQRCAILLSQ